jgi:hypothetical protein
MNSNWKLNEIDVAEWCNEWVHGDRFWIFGETNSEEYEMNPIFHREYYGEIWNRMSGLY